MNYVRSLLSRSPEKPEVFSPTKIKAKLNTSGVVDYEKIQREEYIKLCQLEKEIMRKYEEEKGMPRVNMGLKTESTMDYVSEESKQNRILHLQSLQNPNYTETNLGTQQYVDRSSYQPDKTTQSTSPTSNKQIDLFRVSTNNEELQQQL